MTVKKKNTLNKKKSEQLKELRSAVNAGDIHTVEKIFDSGLPVDEQMTLHQTALHKASESGYIDIVRLLLARGGTVEARDYRGFTPLHLAVRGGHLDVVRLLLETGADPSTQNTFGKQPLHDAAVGVDPRYRTLVDMLVESGAEVDGLYETTPLSYAAAVGNEATVYRLVELGADPGGRSEGLSPAGRADEGGHVKIAAFLREAEARKKGS